MKHTRLKYIRELTELRRQLATNNPKSTGPEVDPQAGLEPGQRLERRPRLPADDVGDRGVIHPGEVTGLAEADPVEGVTQSQGNLPCDLGDRVAAGEIGPVIAELVRMPWLGWFHTPTLDPEKSPLVSPNMSKPADRSVGYYQQWGAGSLDEKINNYKPQIPAKDWEAIGDFVRSAMLDVEGFTVYNTVHLMASVTRYVQWCWRVAGIPLERERIFSVLQIEEFIAARAVPTWNPSSYANRRTELLRVCEALDTSGAKWRLSSLRSANVEPPYSAKEVVVLRNWAAAQRTRRRSHDATILLGLCIGAGMSAVEAGQVRARDVTIDEHGVVVEVRGTRPRTVPVLRAWEQDVIDSVGRVGPDMYVFRPLRTGADKNLTNGFIARCTTIDPVVTTQRMRATWFVIHLNAGTPLAALTNAAGITSLTTITRYLPLLDPITGDVYRDILRGGEQ